MTASARHIVGVHYALTARADAAWELPDETMPESVAHDEAVELLKALLSFWAHRVHREQEPARFVARNLAVRWDEQHPKVGIDPDVCVLSPPPPDPGALTSLRTWLPGHAAPVLAVEVVSGSNPRKNYALAPDRYAASGVAELWIVDPLLHGPPAHGGPHRIQLWSRRSDGDFVRFHAGDGPVFSPTLEAWLVVVDEGRRVRIAEDAAGTRPWQTPLEAEREAKDAALARIAELEARLASR